MKSMSEYGAEITARLGDKTTHGIAQAVSDAKEDLTDYRTVRPRYVAEASERGLANWIHDRLWIHLIEQLDEDPATHFRDRGPTREFRVGTKYLFRAKRHRAGDRISSYPTPTAQAFWNQDTITLFPDADEVRLAAGYRWDPELREINEAVISLRDGMDHVVWAVSLVLEPQTNAVQIRPLDDEAPALPFIDVAEEAVDDDESDTGSGE